MRSALVDLVPCNQYSAFARCEGAPHHPRLKCRTIFNTARAAAIS